jgi:phage/plasmid-associated DNA primase
MTYSEKKIKKFLTFCSQERFAKLFIEQSQTKIIVFSKKEVFVYNDKFNYYEPVDIHGRFLSLVSNILHDIIEPWDEHFSTKLKTIINNKELDKDEQDQSKEETKKIQKQIKGAIKQIETITFLKNVIESIVSMSILSKEDQDKLERLDNHLNFRNGKLNLKTLEFSVRTDEDFVVEYLDYDYQKPKKEIKNEVIEVLKKICNSSNDDYDFIMRFLGYCITSETKEQKYLNVVGETAANGKSTLIKLMEEALPIYIFKAKKDLFSEAFSKGHKYFSQTKGKRIVYIEELDKKKVDADLLKDVVDGNKMNNEVLFSTTEKIDINFKLMFLSNNLMNFDADSGIKRRLIHFEFKNKFVDKEDIEKERLIHKVGTVFEVDRTLLNKFKSDEYKNALISLLIKKSKQYFTDGLIVPPKYINIAKEVCDENDKFKNFFDDHFDITNNDADRIAKAELHDMYNAHTKCNFSPSSIMTEIKRLQLKYDRCDLRCSYNGKSVHGVLLGIKKKAIERRQTDYGYGDSPVADDELLKKNIQLEKELNELKEQYEKIRVENEDMKKQLSNKNKIVEYFDADSEDDKKDKPKKKTKNKITEKLEFLDQN